MFLNEAILGVALPTLIAQISIAAATAQWLNTAILLTTAVEIPVTRAEVAFECVVVSRPHVSHPDCRAQDGTCGSVP